MDKLNSEKKRAMLFWGAVGFALLGLPAWWSMFADYRTSVRSAGWPSVEGLVIASEVVVNRGRGKMGNGTGTRSGDGSVSGGPTYSLELQVSYSVGGQPFVCERVAFGGNPGGSQSAANLGAQQYPVGLRTMVYYDPAVPSSSVLVAGANLMSTLAPFLALLLVPWGMGFALFVKSFGREKFRLGRSIAIAAGTYGVLCALCGLLMFVAGM